MSSGDGVNMAIGVVRRLMTREDVDDDDDDDDDEVEADEVADDGSGVSAAANASGFARLAAR